VAGRRVAVPNNVCLNVPLAVIYAGAIPVYCDIDPETLGLSVEALQKCLPPPAAAIAVHAYGSVCDIGNLEIHCQNAGIFLIEDVAAAQGASFRGRPAGSFGDCSILSFGNGKIIDAGGGGAILTEDSSLTKDIEGLHVALPPRSKDHARRLLDFDRCHTQLYNDHYGRDLALYASAFLARAVALQNDFLSRPACDFDTIMLKVDVLSENLDRRNRLAQKLRDALEGLDNELVMHRPEDGSVYWRCNLFLRTRRDQVLKALLAEQFRISSWFPSADLFLGGRQLSGAQTPVSDRQGDEILNIWIDHHVDDQYIESISDKIKQFSR